MPPQYSSRLSRKQPKTENQIRRYRLQFGMTQKDVAKELGVRASTISAWERGLSCPTLRPMAKLAKILNTLVEGLYPDLFFSRPTDPPKSSPQ